jgi:hypothetical protein
MSMYRCDGRGGCGRPIAASAEKNDPVHQLSGRGTLCTSCLRKPEPQEPERPPSRSRGDASRARWAAMTPAQKAERIAKMKAGQAARASEAEVSS